MNKIINALVFAIILAATSFSSAFARPNKVTIGVYGLNSDVKHQFSREYPIDDPVPDQNDTSDKAIGYGFSLGYIGYYRNVFVSPELFFDQINSNARDFFANQSNEIDTPGEIGPYSEDEISINYRVGARMNLGVFLNKYIGVYANAGIASVDFDVRWKHPTAPDSSRSYGSSEVSPVYGFGLLIHINKNLMLRASHDMQEFNLRYMNNGHIDMVDLKVTRVGAVFTF